MWSGRRQPQPDFNAVAALEQLSAQAMTAQRRLLMGPGASPAARSPSPALRKSLSPTVRAAARRGSPGQERPPHTLHTPREPGGGAAQLQAAVADDQLMEHAQQTLDQVRAQRQLEVEDLREQARTLRSQLEAETRRADEVSEKLEETRRELEISHVSRTTYCRHLGCILPRVAGIWVAFFQECQQ